MARRIAALYDIHGNAAALRSVLDELTACNVDLVVLGGDVVPGPEPLETFELLRSLELPMIAVHGNGESAVLLEAASRGDELSLPEPVRESIRYTVEQLSGDVLEEIAGWPLTQHVRHETLGELLFCHATPRDDNEIFTRTTPAAAVESALLGVEAEIVICGHTHMQFDRTISKTRVINAGSIGLPFGATGAHWLLLGDAKGEGDGAELRRSSYDVARAAARIRTLDYPMAEQVANDLEAPRSEAEMLQIFSAVELGS